MLDTGYAKPSYHNLCSNSGIYITVVKGFHSLRCKTEQVSIVSDWGHLEFSRGGWGGDKRVLESIEYKGVVLS